jgi:hypothetical protein
MFTFIYNMSHKQVFLLLLNGTLLRWIGQLNSFELRDKKLEILSSKQDERGKIKPKK